MPAVEKIIFFVLEAIIGILSVVTNSLVILDIYRKRDFLSTANIFTLHLALADVCVGMIIPPIHLIVLLQSTELSFSFCLFYNSIIAMFANTSIIMLFCLAGERFIAIRFPFYYQSALDCRNVTIFLLGVWAFCFALGFLPYIWNTGSEHYRGVCEFAAVIPYEYLFYVRFLIVNAVPLIGIICINLYIAIVVRRIKCKTVVIRKPDSTAPKRVKKRRCNHPFHLVLIIFLCLVPLHVFNMLSYFEVTETWGEDVETTCLYAAILMCRCNSVVNPFVYANSHLKSKLQEMSKTSQNKSVTSAMPHTKSATDSICSKSGERVSFDYVASIRDQN